MYLTGDLVLDEHWRVASRRSAQLAPSPATESAAVVQVYAARAYNWRGAFAVHTWISVKREFAPSYTVYELIGWRLHMGLPALSIGTDLPDRFWFGHPPEVLLELRGAEAESAIPKIEAAARSYKYPDTYRVWPGPNSNTFTAYVLRNVPDLKIALPNTAIGKDYLPERAVIADAPSNTGKQLSIIGLLGVTVARVEGIRIHSLGLEFGIDAAAGEILWPGVGRVKLPLIH